jgi:hypothetical protein
MSKMTPLPSARLRTSARCRSALPLRPFPTCLVPRFDRSGFGRGILRQDRVETRKTHSICVRVAARWDWRKAPAKRCSSRIRSDLGGESHELTNLHPHFPIARGFLPDVTLGVHVGREDRDEWHVAKLDGVHFDWRSDERVLLTWRARFPLPEAGETRLTLNSVVFSEEAHEIAEAAE